jgi:excisionase family DNA binding protein
VTCRTPAGEVAPGERPPDGRPDPAPGAYWDLDLLTPDDVCALLKVKKSWLYDAVEDGSIETIRLGKQLRFRPSAIIRYLEQRAKSGNGHQRPLVDRRG